MKAFRKCLLQVSARALGLLVQHKLCRAWHLRGPVTFKEVGAGGQHLYMPKWPLLLMVDGEIVVVAPAKAIQKYLSKFLKSLIYIHTALCFWGPFTFRQAAMQLIVPPYCLGPGGVSCFRKYQMILGRHYLSSVPMLHRIIHKRMPAEHLLLVRHTAIQYSDCRVVVSGARIALHISTIVSTRPVSATEGRSKSVIALLEPGLE